MDVKKMIPLIVSVFAVVSSNSLTYYYESILSTYPEECFNSIAIIEKNLNGIASIFDFYNAGASLNFLADYQDCLETPTQTKYVLAVIQGQLDNEIYMKHTGYGIYFEKNTSFLGMCLPQTCVDSDLERLKNLTTSIAQSNGFTEDVIVSFREEAIAVDSSATNPVKYIMLFTLILLALLVIIGSMVECTQIGNKNDFITLPVHKSTSYKQINSQLLIIKEKWALFLLAFSFFRNNLHVLARRKNLRTYKKQIYNMIKQNCRDDSDIHSQDERLTVNDQIANKQIAKARNMLNALKIFDGLKMIHCFSILMGTTLQLCHFQLMMDPKSIDDYVESFKFTFFQERYLSGIEIFFFSAGFLQTYSFLSKYSKKNALTFTLKYLLIRIFKLVPLYYLYICTVLYVLEVANDSPTKAIYDLMLEPCQSYSWTTFLFMNNLVPDMGNGKEACMIWTWFIPLYLQLSLLLPVLLVVVIKYDHKRKNVFLLNLTICLVLIIICGIIFRTTNTKFQSFSYNSDYFVDIISKPWGQYTTFLGVGHGFGLVFYEYIRRKTLIGMGASHQNRIGYTALHFIKKKETFTIIVLVSGALLYLLIIIVAHFYTVNSGDWSEVIKIILASVRAVIQTFCFVCLILPLLVNRFKLIQLFLSLKIWVYLSNLSLGFYLWFPIIVLDLFFSQNSKVYIGFGQLAYYAISAGMWSLCLAYLSFILVQGPVISLMTIFSEAEEQRYSLGYYGFGNEMLNKKDL